MRGSGFRRSWPAGAFVVALAIVVAPSAVQTWAASDESYSFSSPELQISNLIGEITISGHAGPDFEVVVHIQGKDATGDAVHVDTQDDSRHSQLVVRFPSEHGTYIYPRLGKGSKTTFSPNKDGNGGWFSEVLGSLFGGRVTVVGSGRGREMWADIEVKVPDGGTLEVRHGVGEVRASDVDGKLDLEVRSGRVGAEAIRGDLAAETGSGHVTVSGVDGTLKVSTGSGGVEVRQVRGPKATVATGSGSVELEGVDSESLSIATGSGRVDAEDIGTDQAHIATGSGGVALRLTRMGGGEFAIGTGSGRVSLEVPADASMDVHAETSSGGIDLDLDGEMTMRRKERDEVDFTLGGGDARVRIGTGSGGIRISQAR